MAKDVLHRVKTASGGVAVSDAMVNLAHVMTIQEVRHPYPTLSYLILPFLLHSIILYLILLNPILAYPTRSYPTLSYLSLFYPS